MSKKKPTKEQLIYKLDFEVRKLEESFIQKFIRKVKTWQNKIINNNNNPYSIGRSEISGLKAIIKDYSKQLSKITIIKTNEELKTLAGNKRVVTVPENNSIDSIYDSKEKAIEKVKAYQKLVINNLKKLDINDKESQIEAIKKTFNLYKARHIDTTAQTQSIAIVNTQRLESFRKSRIVKGVQFLAVLDKSTTDICRSRNGMILKLDDPRLNFFTPPLHYNCRSYLSPVTIYEKNTIFTSQDDLKNVPKPLFDKGIEKATSINLSSRQNIKNLIQPSVKRGEYNSNGYQVDPKPELKTKILTPRAFNKVLREQEKDILKSTKNKFERAICIDSKGNILLDKDGTKSQVTFTKSELKKCEGAKAFTHNHPSSSSLSFDDFFTTHKFKIQQIRAIAPDNKELGNIVFYINNASNYDVKEVEKLYNLYREELKSKYVEKVMSNELSNIEANQYHSHEIWLNIKDYFSKKDILFDYGYIKVD